MSRFQPFHDLARRRAGHCRYSFGVEFVGVGFRVVVSIIRCGESIHQKQFPRADVPEYLIDRPFAAHARFSDIFAAELVERCAQTAPSIVNGEDDEPFGGVWIVF